MTRTAVLYKIILLISLAALSLSGCSSKPPVEFYTLSAISKPQTGANTNAVRQPVSVGVGPVVIPEVLDRPQIVTRTGPYKLRIDEFNRWAGRLGENFAWVVAENISVLLPSEQVAVYPWDVSFKPRYQVILDVQRFEGRMGQGEVLLEVLWQIIDPQNQAILRIKKSVIREPLAATDYETLVATQSRAIQKLSDLIVKQIGGL